MKKFEYTSIPLCDRIEDSLESLNKWGQEGWSFCDTFAGSIFLKRELPDDNEIQLKYKDLTIQATIIKDFGEKAIVLAQDRVSLAFKRNGRWESFTPGFDLLEF